MAFAIKAEIHDLSAETFAFTAQKTMYGGKHIAEGDLVFLFASENEGGQGLVAQAVVTSSEATAKKRGIARQTPRVSIAARRTALARRPLGRRRAQTLHGLARRPTRDRAQFQILSPGNEQDRRHLGSSGSVPAQLLLIAAHLGRLLHVMTKLDGFVGSAAIVSSGLKAARAPRARAAIPLACRPPLPPPP